jgi:hypothetical protein
MAVSEAKVERATSKFLAEIGAFESVERFMGSCGTYKTRASYATSREDQRASPDSNRGSNQTVMLLYM